MTAGTASAPAASTPSNLPRAFGRYVLFDLIGRGGMADIYLARMGNSLGSHRLCVIKEIRDNFDDDPSFMELLTAEAKLAARLNHANIVQVFDLGREGGRLFLAMDYVEGFDLHQLLKRLSQSRLPLPAEFAFSIVIETLRALDYAHRARDEQGRSLGIVHRDVSPSNVLISFEGEVKLCDFGIARAAGESGDDATIARTRVAGKAAYMAPEHARGEVLDARADVFAAGILLWELAAGRRLYKAATGDDVLALARAAHIPRLPERGIPNQAALQAILDRALAPRREDRFETAAEFLEALEDYAIEQRLRASPLRFGAFMSDHFAGEIIHVRRERERAIEQIDLADGPDSYGPASAPPSAGPPAPILPPVAPLPAEAHELINASDDDVFEEDVLDEVLDEVLEEDFEEDFEEELDEEPAVAARENSLVPPSGASQEIALGSLPPEPIKPGAASSAPAPKPSGDSNDLIFYSGLAIASVVLALIAYFVVSALL